MSPIKILAILTLAFIAFSVETDIYVPSFPNLVIAFGVGEGSMLSANFLGVCLSCLFTGPLSDSLGRKRVLSVGTGLFMLASLVCCVTNDFSVLLSARFIQGLGAGTILAVACTCIFDLYDPNKSGQLMAVLNAVVTVTMSLAPITGVWLNLHFGWRSCFIFILILATLTWIGMTFFLPETLPVKSRVPFHPKTVLRNYFKLCLQRRFIFNTIVWNLMITALIVYTANSSLLFLDHFHLTPQAYGWYQSLTMVSFGVFSLICSYLIGKWGSEHVRLWGTGLFFVGTLALVTTYFYAPMSPLLISLGMAVVSAGTTLACVSYFTNAMLNITSTGVALSLAQALRLLFSAGLTDLSRILFNGTFGSILAVLIIIALLTLACLFFIPRSPEVMSENPQAQPLV